MSSTSFCILALFLLAAQFIETAAKSPRSPFVVVPPTIRWNAANRITVTPVATFSLVEIEVIVTAVPENHVVFRQKLLAKQPVEFRVGDSTSLRYRLRVQVSQHAPFQVELRGTPNVRRLHIQTDKLFYKPSETVNVRALPLTEEGDLYGGPVEYSLVNPQGFELLRQTVKAKGRFARLQFELPEHLYFGEWKVFARPSPASPHIADSFSTTIQVQDYELPPISVFFEIDNAIEEDKIIATVQALHPHGANVSGSLRITCDPKHSAISSLIYDGQISNGLWNGDLNFTQCLGGPRREVVTITAAVRDSGTGGPTAVKRTLDPLSPGFELLPLRPAYNVQTRALPFLARTLDRNTEGKPLVVRATCLSSKPKGSKYSDSKTINTRVGETFSVPLADDWSMCPVIIVEASRTASPRLRPSVVTMPSVRGNNTLWLSFIDEAAVLRAPYTVGEKFQAEVPVKVATNANYLAVCGNRDIAVSGKVRDDGVITFDVSRAMAPHCILYVYTVTRNPHTDMILFHVNDACEFAATSSKSVVEPGENITITMSGEANALASLQLLDQRMQLLIEARHNDSAKHWDLSFFKKPELKGDQARLINFLNASEVSRTISETCKEASILYSLAFNNTCVPDRISTSAVSDLCNQQMVLACNLTHSPQDAASCDRKSGRPCGIMKTTPRINLAFPFPRIPGFSRIQISQPESTVAAPPQDAPEMIVSTGEGRPDVHVRDYFPHVWLFDDYQLGPTGSKTIEVGSPDSITKWNLAGRFWAPGRLDSCLAPTSEITTKKTFFMTVELPKSVYVNESITVKVSVSAENLRGEKKLSVCFTGLERAACGDEGADGNLGQPTYSRVLISPLKPIDSKTFSLRFLTVGSLSLSFSLRTEESFPGKHHCEIGKLLDQVRYEVTVAKRAETEEHYKRIILNANKPVHTLTRMQLVDSKFVSLDGDIPMEKARELLDYTEHRNQSTPNAVYTEAHVNIPDTETVYSFTIEISKFLAHSSIEMGENMDDTPEHSNALRSKRSIEEFGNSFLTDVLKQLSTTLYAFKHLRVGTRTDLSYRVIERMESKIGALLSDMLRFSDCRPEHQCGFNEYRRPIDTHDRSFLLTTLSTSLLCEADADEAIVCGALDQITEYAKSIDTIQIDLHNLIDLEKDEDKRWFMKGLLYQLANDCASYSCVKKYNVWTGLYKDFYQLDENAPLDTRTVAALAFLGPNNTNDIMRLKMYSSVKENMMPYWTAGGSSYPVYDKLRHGYEVLVNLKKIKSGDVLVNSLGMLAFVGKGVDTTKSNLDFDSLADWLNEQQNEDDTYSSALDTYFASRALYEFRHRRIVEDSDASLTVDVICSTCESRTINVSASPAIVYIPVGVKNVTLITKGEGKVKAGLRVLSSRRQRSRRELAVDYYPVHIAVEQQKIALGVIRQIVCLRIFSPVLTVVEITHGLYTGFTTGKDKIAILSNSSKLDNGGSGMEFVRSPELSAYAVHMVFKDLDQNRDLCYQVGLSEPSSAHEPGNLAPVAITARHPVNDIIGQTFISHPDIGRARRSTSADSIDTVCFEGGNCACAETTCSVKCGLCSRATKEELRAELCRSGAVGATVEVMSSSRTEVDGAAYRVLNVTVHHWAYTSGKMRRPASVELWVRECNVRCLNRIQTNAANPNLIFVGLEDAFVVDLHARLHYVLRNEDRLEPADSSCTELPALVFSSDPADRCAGLL